MPARWPSPASPELVSGWKLVYSEASFGKTAQGVNVTDWRIIVALISLIFAVHCGGGDETFSGGGNEGAVPGTAAPEEDGPPTEPEETGEPADGDEPAPGTGDPGDPEAPADQDSGTSFPVPQ